MKHAVPWEASGAHERWRRYELPRDDIKPKMITLRERNKSDGKRGKRPAARTFRLQVTPRDLWNKGGPWLAAGVSLSLVIAAVLSLAIPHTNYLSTAAMLAAIVSLIWLSGAILAALRRAPLIIVGTDGVLIRDRFVPYSRITDVRHEWRYEANDHQYSESGPVDEWRTSVLLNSGESIVLREARYGRPVVLWGTWKGIKPVKTEPVHEDALGAQIANAIEEVKSAWMKGCDDREIEENMVARGGRPVLEWLRALRRINSTDSYRNVPVDAERLSRLVDDFRASPSARAAAAIVLAASGDARMASRLRIAAASVANPRLRVTLDDIAEARDDAAIAEALAALDEADSKEHA